MRDEAHTDRRVVAKIKPPANSETKLPRVVREGCAMWIGFSVSFRANLTMFFMPDFMQFRGRIFIIILIILSSKCFSQIVNLLQL